MQFTNLFRLFWFGSTLLMLTACQSTSSGVGSSPKVISPSKNFSTQASKTEAAIDVLDLTYEEAVNLAFEAARRAYQNVRVTDDRSMVYIENRSFWQGDARAFVEPVIVKDNESSALGIVYEVKAEGFGGNFSFVPSYISSKFFQELAKLKTERSVKTTAFSSFSKLPDKGIVETISASVPTTFSGFAKYIDSKNDKFEKEGIWESEDGSYVLGLVRDNSDIRFRYKAFVIESKRPEWKVGDVKIKFSKLDDSGVAAARYFMGNKLEIGATFEASNSALIGISPREPSLIFIKTYPRDEETKSAGSGSGWHIGNGYLVTNAHVISKAKSINVIIGGNPYGARATLVDEKLDLAILKIADGHPKMKAIALANEVASGEKIFAIGYPLGALLGGEPKISDGLVGALSGIKGDPTVLSISAPIQPGNSGGPLLNEYGNVVGVVVSKLRDAASNDQDVENINYAVKVSYLRPLVSDLGELPQPNPEKLDNICSEFCEAVFLIETK